MTQSIQNDTNLYFAIIPTDYLELDNDYLIEIDPILVTTTNVEKHQHLYKRFATNINDKTLGCSFLWDSFTELHYQINHYEMQKEFTIIVIQGYKEIIKQSDFRVSSYNDLLLLAKYIKQDHMQQNDTPKKYYRKIKPNNRCVYRNLKTNRFLDSSYRYYKMKDAQADLDEWTDETSHVHIHLKKHTKEYKCNAFTGRPYRTYAANNWKYRNKCKRQWQKHQKEAKLWTPEQPKNNNNIQYTNVKPTKDNTIVFNGGTAQYNEKIVTSGTLVFSPWLPQLGVMELLSVDNPYTNETDWIVNRNHSALPAENLQLQVINNHDDIHFDEWADIELNSVAGSDYDWTAWPEQYQPKMPTIM